MKKSKRCAVVKSLCVTEIIDSGEGENVKEYLFGGDYPGSSDVAVTKSPAGDSIEAVWSVDGLTVTQTVALANQEANESGISL